MNSLIEPSDTSRSLTPGGLHLRDLKIAMLGALSAGLCLGLPAGLFFWFVIVQSWVPSLPIGRLVNFFQDDVIPLATVEILGAIGWGFFLAKISGYRQWWWLSAATIAGVRTGDFVLYNGRLDQWVQIDAPGLSLHVRFGLILSVAVLCVTVSTGLLLGFVLLNWKASLMLAASTGFTSVLAALVTLLVLDGLGIRVGSGNAAMPRAAAGGAVLAVVFSRYVRIRLVNFDDRLYLD
jgi:hypothetical protein